MISNTIKDIARKLVVCDNFGLEDNDSSFVYDYIYDQLDKLIPPDKFTIETGATKLAIIFSEENSILKIPFNGYYDEDDEWYEFEKANDMNDNSSCWDYCENELIKYAEIKKAGMADFFPQIQLITVTDNDQRIYVQEKITPLEDVKEISCSKEATDSYSTLMNINKTYLNEAWMCSAIDYYGKDKIDSFITFIKKNRYDDLHDGNLGFIKERPVVLDWAGYREC